MLCFPMPGFRQQLCFQNKYRNLRNGPKFRKRPLEFLKTVHILIKRIDEANKIQEYHLACRVFPLAPFLKACV